MPDKSLFDQGQLTYYFEQIHKVINLQSSDEMSSEGVISNNQSLNDLKIEVSLFKYWKIMM
jgi:hypothetical protein